MNTPALRCNAEDWAYDDNGEVVIYGTCQREYGHEGKHVEMRDGKLWAEWTRPSKGPRPGRIPDLPILPQARRFPEGRAKSLKLRNGNEMVVSPTQLNTMKTCPRMWFYNYIERRVRSGAFAARDAGKAFDAALNRRYLEAGAGAVSEAVEARMLADIDKGFAELELPEDEYRTAARLKEVVREYNKHYGEEAFDVLGVQVPFEVEVGDVEVEDDFWRAYWLAQYKPNVTITSSVENRPLRLFLHGILDLLVRRREDGLVLIVDTKTSSRWDSRSESDYLNHAQMKAYAWAVPRVAAQARARGVFTEKLALFPERVHGVMINGVVIRKPYVREGSAAKANAQPRTEFVRRIHTFSEERLEEWRADTLDQVAEAMRWVASGHYRQNEKHCAFHYGGRCGYMDVCLVPKEQRQIVLGSDLFQDYESAKELETISESKP